MKSFVQKNILLILILLVSLFLRTYNLASVPEGFHADEAAFGYNAYSILQTGKDEYGKVLPLSLKSFGDYKGAVYSYLTIPFVALFGLNETSVRIPTALFGTLFVLLTYIIAYQLTKDKKISLLSCALVSISPLAIFLSRVQSDPLVSVFFVFLGLSLFLYWVEKKRDIFLILAGVFWIISYFTYASPRLFVPVLLLILVGFYGKGLWKQGRKAFLLIFLIVLSVDIFLLVGNSGERFAQLNVFKSPSVILPLEEQIREDGHNSALLARVFHNKPLNYAIFFAKGYFSYFNFDFLFLKGGFPDREILPKMGILNIMELPFLLLGLYKILEKKKRWGLFALLLVLSVPALMAFAVDESPNVHRFFLALLPLEIIGGYGLFESFKFLKRYKLIFLTALLFGFNLLYFLHQIFVHQPVHQPWYRGYANKELAFDLRKYYPDYKKFVITKSLASPYIYILFYQKYDPVKYQSEGSPRDLDYSGFDKYFFVPLDCPLNGGRIGEEPVKGEVGVLYVNKGECLIPKHNARLVKEIKWRDNAPAFQLLEYVSTGSAEFKDEK